MHFSIPDTQEFICDRTGSTFTGYNIHINGNFHCCLRYKQLHSLHEQLKRAMPTLTLPQFPSKKLLPLTQNQLEQRRINLERYIQLIGQDPIFSKSELLRIFLLNAQQESSYIDSHETTLDVYLMNGYRIQVNCYTTDWASKVLEKAAQIVDLSPNYVHFFSLYLMRKEKDGGITLVRKLMDFEAPYITQRKLEECKIVIRKSYWDPLYDQALLQDNISLNLLYILTLSDIEQGWIITTKEIREQLTGLQSKGNKKEYLEIAKKLPSYGCIKFSNAIVDYPKPNEVASIVIGNKELCIQTFNGQKLQETKFKVTRMRCWRVTTNYGNEDLASNSSADSGHSSNSCNSYHTMELSFEYLMAKNTLKWISITSEQAMLMSVCLQSMVDELLNQKDGHEIGNMLIQQTPQHPILTYVRRDGKVHQQRNNRNRISSSSSNETLSSLPENDVPLHVNCESITMRQRLKEKISTTVFFRNGKDSVHNEAFEEIGDDDL